MLAAPEMVPQHTLDPQAQLKGASIFHSAAQVARAEEGGDEGYREDS
jgi:hypothetical protein